jgi:hypothetical protein
VWLGLGLEQDGYWQMNFTTGQRRTRTMTELKPCKCLSQYPRLIGPLIGLECGYCVKCDGGRATPIYCEKDEAIDAWNKRS